MDTGAKTKHKRKQKADKSHASMRGMKKVKPYMQLSIPFGPQPATAVNHALAAEIKGDYDNMRQGECYLNAILGLASLDLRRKSGSSMEYVEGWLVGFDENYANEHGWIEIDNAVVDVTLIGQFEASAYYAVYRYSFGQVQKMIGRRGISLPLFANTTAGEQEMVAAFKQLPIDHSRAQALACLGYLKTGKWSVAIPEGAFVGERR